MTKSKKFVKASWYQTRETCENKQIKKIVKLQWVKNRKMAKQGSKFFLKFIVKVNLDTFGQPQWFLQAITLGTGGEINGTVEPAMRQ